MIIQPEQWLARHYRMDSSASKQVYDPDHCRWLHAPGGPIRAFANPRIRQGACMTPAQGGKTETGKGLLLWALDQQPGPAMWVLPAKDEVQTFGESRLMPTINACAPLARKLPSKRWATKTLEVQWPFGPLLLVGANSGSKLSGKPIRYLFLDEEKDYPAGATQKAMKRVTAFRGSKIWRMSTPKRVNESIHLGYLEGTQSAWHVRCPKCGHAGEVTWERMRWEKDNPSADERTRSLRVACGNEACDHCWHERADDRRALATAGEWVAGNPDAPSTKYSAHWSRLIVPWAAWGDVLSEYEQAAKALTFGIQEPMAIWYQECLGLPYEPGQLEAEDPIPEGPYLLGDPWADSARRIMGVDVQKDRLEVVVRAVAKSGESRLHWEGIQATFDDLEAPRIQFGIEPNWVMIDARYNTAEELRACHRFGWTACVGDDRDDGYVHSIRGQSIRRAFSPAQKVDTGIGGARHGLYCWQFRWSNRLIKDTLALLSTGKASASPWTIARDTSREYKDQLRGEVLRTVYDRDTGQPRQKWVKRHRDRGNHRWDCECMVLVGMLAGGLLSADVAEEIPPPSGLPGAPPGG
jgi:hypothetical protein